MGRSKKRRRAYVRTMKSMQKEGQGVYRLTLITPPDMLEMLAIPPSQAAPEVVRLVAAVVNFMRLIETAQPTALCLLCDNELVPAAPPRSFALLTAHRDEPRHASVAGICSTCSHNSDLEARAVAKYRETNPDLRLLPTPSAAGHA